MTMTKPWMKQQTQRQHTNITEIEKVNEVSKPHKVWPLWEWYILTRPGMEGVSRSNHENESRMYVANDFQIVVIEMLLKIFLRYIYIRQTVLCIFLYHHRLHETTAWPCQDTGIRCPSYRAAWVDGIHQRLSTTARK